MMWPTQFLPIARGRGKTITQLVRQHASPATSVSPGIVVIDEKGEAFDKIRGLELAQAIWRTVGPPTGRALPEGTLVVLVVSGGPDWEVVRALAKRHPTILAADSPRTADALAALRHGAFGYVDLAMPAESLRRTLLGALKGEPAFRREVLGASLRDERHLAPRTPDTTGVLNLTARQREIVALIARGATDKEIAASLGIRTATAQKHVANLRRRLGVTNRAAAVGLVFKDAETLPPVRRRSDKRRR